MLTHERLRQNYIEAHLNSNGCPKNPNKISLAVQRSFTQNIDFVHKMRTRDPVSFPAKYAGRWSMIKARVGMVVSSVDGTLLHLRPLPGGIHNPESWDLILFWIPTSGSCGVF